MARVLALLEDATTHSIHPRYFGLLNQAPAAWGQVADLITARMNPQLALRPKVISPGRSTLQMRRSWRCMSMLKTRHYAVWTKPLARRTLRVRRARPSG